MKAGGETEQNGENAGEIKMTRELENRREVTGQGKNLELEIENTRSYFKKNEKKKFLKVRALLRRMRRSRGLKGNWPLQVSKSDLGFEPEPSQSV